MCQRCSNNKLHLSRKLQSQKNVKMKLLRLKLMLLRLNLKLLKLKLMLLKLKCRYKISSSKDYPSPTTLPSPWSPSKSKKP